MALLDKLRDALVPRTEKGVRLRCTDCGEEVGPEVTECPRCGSTEIKEEEGFELRPQG